MINASASAPITGDDATTSFDVIEIPAKKPD